MDKGIIKNNYDKDDIKWYPVRVTYSRELKLKEYFEGMGVETFLPMHYVKKRVVKEGQEYINRVLVPIIHNLLFIHSTKKIIDEYKFSDSLASSLRYIEDPTTRMPAVVSDREMHNFMLISQTNDDGLIYISNEEIKLKVGDRYRIINGLFKGAEGELIRVKGDRRVVVRLNGLMAVATTFIHPRDIEKI